MKELKTKSLDKDALLADMRLRFPNREFSPDEIADYAGCSRQYINQVEERALEKLRLSLKTDILDCLGGLDGD